jgi:hypothetical protein
MILRRLRAVLVTALIWACLWVPVGLIIGIYRSFKLQSYEGVPWALPSVEQFLMAILVNVTPWMTWGAISGAVFAILLAFIERRREVSALLIWRTATWGTLGAVALPTIVLAAFLAVEPDFTLLALAVWPLTISAFAGAASAATTLLLAKRTGPALSGAGPAGSLTSA